jgi:hypothetical protein
LKEAIFREESEEESDSARSMVGYLVKIYEDCGWQKLVKEKIRLRSDRNYMFRA